MFLSKLLLYFTKAFIQITSMYQPKFYLNLKSIITLKSHTNSTFANVFSRLFLYCQT